jgi:hypothetical protein
MYQRVNNGCAGIQSLVAEAFFLPGKKVGNLEYPTGKYPNLNP